MTKNLKKHYDYLYSQIKKDIFSKKVEARLKLFWKLLNTQLQNVTTESINDIYILLQIEFGNLAWGKLQQEIEDIILKIFLNKEKTIEIWGTIKFVEDRIENVKVIHIPEKFILSESKILLKKIAYHYNKLRFNPLIEEIYRLPEGLVRATSGDTKGLMERIEKMEAFNHKIYDDKIYDSANTLYNSNTNRGYYYKDAVFDSLPECIGSAGNGIFELINKGKNVSIFLNN